MSSYMALRRISTATSAAAIKPVSISYLKNKLKTVYDPDEALKIYSSYTATNDPSTTSPVSIRYAQEFTVRRLVKSHRFADIETFLESHKSHPQITIEPFVSSLIRSYGVAGMFENALNTYNQMTDFGTPRSSLSFNALLSACVSSKVFDRVPVYFNEFPEKFGFVPDKFSYGILIKAYCEMNSPDLAMEKLNEMQKNGIEIGSVLFTTILHALYKNGRVDEAENFWNEMVTKKGCVFDVVSYNVRLSQIHGGKPEPLKDLMEEMTNAGLKLDIISYNYLITCYALNDMIDEAEMVYEDMLRKAKGVKPNAATFRIMVFHLCKKGRFVKAYKVFKQSVKVGRIPDFNTLKYLLEGLVKNGTNMNEAKAMIRTMKKKFPPELLKAWGKLAEDLGLAQNLDVEEDDSGEMEKVVSSDIEVEKTS